MLKRADRKLAGQVLGLDGKPVAGATVGFNGQGQPHLQWRFPSAKSDSNGHFFFDAICEGDVTVSASYNNIQGNAPAQGGDTNVVVRLGVNLVSYGQNSSPPRKITGTVRDPSGAAVAGVTMSLYPVQGRTLDSQTDSEGRYEFKWQGLAAGNITTWLLARDVKGGLAAIHQVDENMTNLDLSLQEGLTVSTQVHDSGGLPLTNATARVTVWGEANRGFGLNPQPMTKDDDGHFRLTALPQGLRYGFSVGVPGYSSARREAEAEETKTNFLSLPPVVLERTNREVAGQVLDVNGNPATAVRLILQGIGMDNLQTTETDSSGHFVFGAVSRGQVTLNVSDPNHPNYDGRVQAEGGDTNVVLRLAERQKITPGEKGTVSGTVFDPSGTPAAGVILTVLSQRGATIRSDAGGRYTLQWETMPTTGDIPTKAALLGRDPERNLAAIMDVDAKGTNLDLHLQPGLTLSGAVRDTDGQPVTNASVSRLLLYQGSSGFVVSQLPTNVNAQGLFSMSALPQGVRYELLVSADGYGNTHAQAPADKTQTNQFQLPATVLKTANRQLAGQVIGADNKPCWGAQVTVQGEGQPSRTVGRTDSNGHFAINQVCEGPVDVYAFLRPDSGSVQAGRGVVRASGGDTNIVVKLGMTNGVPMASPGGVGQAPTNRLAPLRCGRSRELHSQTDSRKRRKRRMNRGPFEPLVPFRGNLIESILRSSVWGAGSPVRLPKAAASRRTPKARPLFAKAEIHDVVVVHHVGLQFQADFAGAFGLRLPARFRQIGEADDLGADESLLHVGMDGARRLPGRGAGADGPGAVFLAAEGEEADVAALGKGAHEQRLRRRQFRLIGHDHRAVGDEGMGRNRRQFLRRQAQLGDGRLADQPVGHFLQDRLLRVARVASEPGLDKIQVLHEQIAQGGAAGEDGVADGQFLFVGENRLRIDLFLRFHQFVGLVEAGVLDVVVAGRDAGDAKEANFHAQCLGCGPLQVKKESLCRRRSFAE